MQGLEVVKSVGFCLPASWLIPSQFLFLLFFKLLSVKNVHMKVKKMIRAVIKVWASSYIDLYIRNNFCYFVSELYQQQVSSPVTSRADQAYPAVACVKGYSS